MMTLAPNLDEIELMQGVIYMKKFAVVLSAIVLLVPQQVLAENWVRLDERIVIDADSILMNGELRRYWTLFDLGNSQFSMNHEILNCITREGGTMKVVVYDSYGRVSDSKTYAPEKNIRNIIPGSKGSIVYNYVCN